MKKTVYKVLAVVLSVCLITGAGATYYAKADKNEEEGTSSGISDYISKKDYEARLYQDETVYVINNNDGDTQKVIVVDKLRDNENGTDEVTKKQLNAETPVDIKVTYALDGTEMSAADIAGKSGHVTITYEYTNRQFENIEINGSEEKIYVPFVAVTGMLLNDKVFSNITVEGGRVIDDGSRKAVVGVVFPGLLESLGNSEAVTDKVKIPGKLTVEADAVNFELGTVYTLVTNYNFDEFAVDEEGLEGDISDKIRTAVDGFTQLVEGSLSLYEGLGDAKDGSAALVDGSAAAYEGAAALVDGASQISNGAGQLAAGIGSAYDGSKQISDGTAALAAGLDTLSGNSAALVGGAKQVFNGLLANAYKGLTDAGIKVPELTIENYSKVLDGVVEELKKTDPTALAKAKVTAAVEANRSTVEAQVAAVVQAQTGATAEMMQSEQMKAVVAQKTEEQIAALIAQNMESADVKAQIAQGQAQIDAGAAQINGVKKSLDDYNTFYQGVKSYTAGVDSADKGVGQLKDGSKSLYAGLGQLKDGANSLQAGSTQLSEGATELKEGLAVLVDGQKALDNGLLQLRDGSKSLNAGLNLINNELVVKIEDILNGDLTSLTDRLKALKQVSLDYKCIDSLNTAEDGAVKFIYKNEAVKATGK